MMYNPDNDIPKTHPGRTNRYVREIRNATQRHGILIESLPLDECTTSTAIELMLSVKHHMHLFMTIVTAIDNPSEFMRTANDYIKSTEKKFHTKLKNLPNNGAEVPVTSSYELALRVIAENCRRANKAIGPKDLISHSSIPIWLPVSIIIDKTRYELTFSLFPGKIIAQLKSLYKNLGPAAAQGGAPRTIAFCIASKEPDELSVSVATSKDIWIPASFLQQWVLATRAERFGEKGVQACKRLIIEVDEMVNLSNENRNVEVLRLAANGHVARDLRPLKAQAFDGNTFEDRDRCWRCC